MEPKVDYVNSFSATSLSIDKKDGIPQTTTAESLYKADKIESNANFLSGFLTEPEEFSGDSFSNTIPIHKIKTSNKKKLKQKFIDRRDVSE